ncbi:MAG: hypothetical protein H3C62_00970 [Gemmatimonadaceae bacterium]|nr:hypothetical protein [Gemmatimonadaceae bacterium]
MPRILDADQLTIADLTEYAPLLAPVAHTPVTLPDEPPGLGSLIIQPDETLAEVTVLGPQAALVPKSHQARVRALIALRETTRALLRAELAELDTDTLRASLNAQYDAFRHEYGAINTLTFVRKQPTYANLASFQRDPGAPLVAALEDVTEVDGGVRTYAKAAIFFRAVVRPDRLPVATTAHEALAVSLNMTGSVDVEYMATLLRQPPHEILAALGDAVYFNPLSRAWETADAFLSGDVIGKRQALERLDAVRYAAQIAALRAAEPAPLAAVDIRASLGAPWIPADVIASFIDSLTERADSALVVCAPETGRWNVTPRTRTRGQRETRTWGAAGMDVYHLVHACLNQWDVRLTHVVEGRTVTDAVATATARDKQAEIRSAFETWVYADAERTERLVAVYNAKHARRVPRRFSGAHLTFPGLSAAFSPYPHQRDGVARALSAGVALLAWPVGSGKSFALAATAMESRRLGLAKKPWLATPAPLVMEIAREIQALYPLARLLVPTSADATRAGMAAFIARAAVGDFDLVIVSHDLLGRLPLSPTTRLAMLDREIALVDTEAATVDDRRRVGALRARFQRQRDALLAEAAAPGALTFEAVGCDLLLTDEGHAFKNITLPGPFGVFNSEGAKRADDFKQKVWYLSQRTRGRGAVVATGTPIANSLVEAFVWGHVLMPERMAAAGFASLAPWIATFAKKELIAELGPLGTPRVRPQYVRFHNVPELRALLAEVADVVLESDLPFEKPMLRTGGLQSVVVPQSDEFRAITADILRRGARVQPGRGNGAQTLTLMTEWNKCAIDPRLHSHPTRRPSVSKLTAVAEKVASIYRATATERGTQLVFCDVGVPDSQTFSAYAAMRDEMMAQGVAPEEIAFIHDAQTPRALARLMSAMRVGSVRVLIGSIPLMGSGLNVQQRLCAWHLVSIPWRPCDLEQALGRILRPGNEYFRTVDAFVYVTERSSDSYRLQKVEHKARVIAQVLKGDPHVREVEDIDDVVLTLAQIKALASGNPRLLERARVEAELVRTERMAREFARQQWEARREQSLLPVRRDGLARAIADVARDLPRFTVTAGDRFAATVDGRVIVDRAVVHQMLDEACGRTHRAALRLGGAQECFIGQMSGFDFGVRVDRMGREAVLVRGAMTYEAEVPLDGSPRNYCARVERLAARLGDFHAEWTAQLARVERELVEVAQFVATVNPHLSVVDRLRADLAALDRALGFVTDRHAVADIEAAAERGGEDEAA